MPRATRINVLLLCLLSGGLWILAWPTMGGLTPLAFVAWLPMFLAEELHHQRTLSRKRAFAPYAMAGLVLWNFSTTYWLGVVQEPWPTRLLSGGFPTVGNTLLMALPFILARWLRGAAGTRAAQYGFIVLWLSFEHLHFDWDLQWPWLTLGHVFSTRTSWVQWYELTGALGGSLWVLLINLFLFRAYMAHREARARDGRLALASAGLLLIVPLAASAWRYATYVPQGNTMEVVVVQPNVDPYHEKFGGMDPLVQLDRMLDQAAAMMTDSTALVVMPETALQEKASLARERNGDLVLQGLWENDLEASRSVERMRRFLQQRPGTALLTGMSSALLYPAGKGRTGTARPLGGSEAYFDAFNAALMIDARRPARSYHKSKLVAGVEKVPFESVLGKLDGLAIDMGGTTGSLGEQEDRTVFRSALDPRIAVAPLICYESVFGDHVAAHVRNGATLLAIMTNDGWWGTSPGYRQHLHYGRLRAVENRRDIARSANTGVSCFIDQRGDLHQTTEFWVPAALRGEVRLNTRITFFTRYGDQVGRIALLFAVLVLLNGLVKQGQKKRV